MILTLVGQSFKLLCHAILFFTPYVLNVFIFTISLYKNVLNSESFRIKKLARITEQWWMSK